jgi:hypothetical protein
VAGRLLALKREVETRATSFRIAPKDRIDGSWVIATDFSSYLSTAAPLRDPS